MGKVATSKSVKILMLAFAYHKLGKLAMTIVKSLGTFKNRFAGVLKCKTNTGWLPFELSIKNFKGVERMSYADPKLWRGRKRN